MGLQLKQPRGLAGLAGAEPPFPAQVGLLLLLCLPSPVGTPRLPGGHAPAVMVGAVGPGHTGDSLKGASPTQAVSLDHRVLGRGWACSGAPRLGVGELGRARVGTCRHGLCQGRGHRPEGLVGGKGVEAWGRTEPSAPRRAAHPGWRLPFPPALCPPNPRAAHTILHR